MKTTGMLIKLSSPTRVQKNFTAHLHSKNRNTARAFVTRARMQMKRRAVRRTGPTPESGTETQTRIGYQTERNGEAAGHSIRKIMRMSLLQSAPSLRIPNPEHHPLPRKEGCVQRGCPTAPSTGLVSKAHKSTHTEIGELLKDIVLYFPSFCHHNDKLC